MTTTKPETTAARTALFESIEMGSKVTILIPNGKRIDWKTGKTVQEWAERSGKAIIPSPGYWALNMGGRYGTPAVATPENVVAVGRPPAPRRKRAYKGNDDE